MDSSLFIARILGPVLLSVSIGIITNQKFYRKVMEDYCKNAAVVFFTSIAPLAVGIAIITVHNIWIAQWPVIITLFGWCAIVKGAWAIIFPNTVSVVMNTFNKNKSLLIVHSFVVFALGGVLTIFAYFVR